jgi:hypothetical protein
MSPIRIDPDLIAQLTRNGGEVPLAGPDGAPVGYFLTPERYARMHALVASDVTEEDCQRALADPRRHTTDEVFRLLGEG